MKCPKCAYENPADTKFCGNCAAPLVRAETPQGEAERSAVLTETMAIVLTELRTGTTFAGRYEVIEELGKGGMGHVYKVYDQKTREKIALKLLKPDVAADRQAIERFGITALTTGRLNYGDIYARSFYNLGRIEDKLGDKAKARENYTKFLDLWKRADPGLPEPADAKKRLSAL